MVFPRNFAALMNLAPSGWTGIGYLACGHTAFYYLMAVREGDKSFYRWTFYGRLVVLPTFAVFVVLGIAPPIILLFGAWDTGCGIWTGIALRREAA
jgi:hypothetical protein